MLSRGFIPLRPTGSSPEALAQQSFWDRTFGPASRVNNSSTVKVNVGTKVTTFRVSFPKNKTSGMTAYLYGSQGPDYLACYNTNDGLNPIGPGIVYIAKPPDLRAIAAENIAIAAAPNILYTYPNYDWLNQGRDVYDSTDPNNPILVGQQVIYPQYRPGGLFGNVQTYPSLIYAQAADTFAFVPDENGDPTSQKIALIDTNEAGRVWLFFNFTDPRHETE